jgi:Uma2 family endonuclease
MEKLLKGNLSLLDYLKLEEESEVRHEFFYGNLIEMPGATIYHERIIKNLFLLLSQVTLGKNLELFFSGMKLMVPEKGLVFYPDLMIGVKETNDTRFLSDAVFVAEVLSPATRSYDQADKFIAYRTLTSLKYYLLIEPEYYHAALFYLTEDGNWFSETFRKLNEEIALPHLSIKLSLADIYKGLAWD